MFEFKRVASPHSESLGLFFERLKTNGDDFFFSPHPLDREEALRIASRTGRDEYYIGIVDSEVIAYGMLRGWDEGFVIPSLGIAVDPRYRNIGLGNAIMRCLHLAAILSGAVEIRLTVKAKNPARMMYEKFGYVFDGDQSEDSVGFLKLGDVWKV